MSVCAPLPLTHPAHSYDYKDVERQQFMSALTAPFFANRDDPPFVVEGISTKRRPGFSMLQYIVRCCVRVGATEDACFRFSSDACLLTCA
jgi:hypothetical protein